MAEDLIASVMEFHKLEDLWKKLKTMELKKSIWKFRFWGKTQGKNFLNDLENWQEKGLSKINLDK